MKIGIIGAMEVETALLLEQMKIEKETVIAGKKYMEGVIGDKEVVVVESGIGKVQAAMAVQALCDVFHVTHIINTGVAGSLNNNINIGDFVISRDCVFHDVDVTNFGYALGEIPQIGTRCFSGDETMIESAVKAVREVTEVQSFVGRVASGDVFVRDREKKNWIRDNFEADCAEMEGTAIAEACYLNSIPFVVIRAISDKADESVEESYDIFEEKAARHSAKVVMYMLEKCL